MNWAVFPCDRHHRVVLRLWGFFFSRSKIEFVFTLNPLKTVRRARGVPSPDWYFGHGLSVWPQHSANISSWLWRWSQSSARTILNLFKMPAKQDHICFMFFILKKNIWWKLSVMWIPMQRKINENAWPVSQLKGNLDHFFDRTKPG